MLSLLAGRRRIANEEGQGVSKEDFLRQRPQVAANLEETFARRFSGVLRPRQCRYRRQGDLVWLDLRDEELPAPAPTEPPPGSTEQ